MKKKIKRGQKEFYISPRILSFKIEMEEGIATGSANLKPGTSQSPNEPSVGDRNNGGDIGNGDNNFDL
ncbi:hypothetical protein BCY89_27605 [Sphingobacterium siyangense]|uniref:Uncharacterized protein n=1 Tax=Sphingobacterium siyangense TaxID=459529 RepID=A0A420FXJ3_9SPHI|nr:hypothetical protein [Sphingobacterium siyangense]RKF37647.1 hypothetical protein BCY89_27605 [Sphingobacterium siyangense]